MKEDKSLMKKSSPHCINNCSKQIRMVMKALISTISGLVASSYNVLFIYFFINRSCCLFQQFPSSFSHKPTISANSLISPYTQEHRTEDQTIGTIESVHLFAKEANIGEATSSPTMKADERTPSWKLFKLNSPLQAPLYCKMI